LALVQKEVLYGSSNKLYDYMAAAKPIVFAVFADHNRPLEQAQCGVYASPENAEDLAAKLVLIAHMPAKVRAAMGECGRAYVRQHHDYSVLARRLASVLQGLDGRPMPDPSHQTAA